MADLPDCRPLYVTNQQRRRAALTVAEHFTGQTPGLIESLLMLGLAERQGDAVVSVPDPIGENWFAPVTKPYN